MADERQDSFQEKTEPATPKKKEDSRRKGKTAKSTDLNSAVVLMFGLIILYFGGVSIASRLSSFARDVFASATGVEVNTVNAHHFLTQGILALGVTLLPVVIGLMLIGLASSFAQVGFLFTLEPLQPQFGKMNPLKGIKKVLASRRSMVELLKGIFKVSIVAVVAYLSLQQVMDESVSLMDGDAGSILGFMAEHSLAVGLKVALAYLVLAAFDYMFQRFEYERDLRMTKQEVKEEGKMMEGDPLVKSRIRSVQRQIAYKRMMQEIPKADVVVTNPTHYAVAIKYDAQKMSAPKVVAKGADLIAQRIREVARENDVPIVEDKPLAQMLYKSVEIGEEIPEKLFQAVAQVLAYIYRMKNPRSGGSVN